MKGKRNAVFKMIILVLIFTIHIQSSVKADIAYEECAQYGREFLEHYVNYHIKEKDYIESIPFLDYNNQVSAIYIRYHSAYVILSNKNNITEIIEYGCDQEETFIDIVKQKIKKQNITKPIYYWIKDSGYYIVDRDTLDTYEVLNGGIEKCDCNIEVENRVLEEYTASSLYKGGNFYLTNPELYERGYYSKSTKNVKAYNITYKKTSDFSGYINHCAPTAAVNFMKYWYNRNNSKYDALLYKDSWIKTFKKLYSLFETTNKGTYDSNLVPGYKKFFDLVSVQYSSITKSNHVSFNQMKKEIDAGYPFHIMVYKHQKYEEHSMLAVGYVSYVHVESVTQYSNYIRVVDGFSEKANRYINTNVGQNYINMVSVRLK